MRYVQNLSVVSGLALLLGSSACILVGDGDTGAADGGAGGSTSSSSANGGAGGTSSTGGSGGTGGTSGSGGNLSWPSTPGPTGDLVPDATAPGAHVCAGCPEGQIDTDDLDVGQVTTTSIDGRVSGQIGHGKFLVFNASGQFAGGGLLVNETTGEFTQDIPLFCGENLVKMYFHNDAGTSAFVRRVTNSGCLVSDVRVTVAWDETTRHWGTHLIRFGGAIYDQSSDCQDSANCYPGSNYTDWGAMGDRSDDPVQDLSKNYIEMAVENIYYPNAEDGLKVMVDNKDDFGSFRPSGTVYVNVHGLPTYALGLEGTLMPKHILTVAKVDGAAGTLTEINEQFDCTDDWDLGECGVPVP